MARASAVTAAFLFLGVLSMPALAGDLAEKGPHCGIMMDAGEYRLELVVSVQTLVVYILDHENNALPDLGLTGKATITAGDAIEKFFLTAYPGGVLSGSGSFPETGPLNVYITLNSPDRDELTAGFGEVRLTTASFR